jgi:hypothetical protein
MLKNKIGLSPVIATVLLISITIVLASVIFFQMRSFLGDQMRESDVILAQACKGVAFDLDYKIVGNEVDLRVANRGNVPISDLNVKLVRGGESNLQNFSGFFAADVGMASSNRSVSIVGVNQIVVYPIVQLDVSKKGVLKNISCADGKVINL